MNKLRTKAKAYPIANVNRRSKRPGCLLQQLILKQ